MSLLWARAPAANTAISKMKTVVLNRIVSPQPLTHSDFVLFLNSKHAAAASRPEGNREALQARRHPRQLAVSSVSKIPAGKSMPVEIFPQVPSARGPPRFL